MKLTNQQLNVLAQTVLDKVKSNKPKITPQQEKIINEFIKNQDLLTNEIEKINNKIDKLREKVKKDLKIEDNLWNYSKNQLVHSLPSKNPTLEEIKNKIVLESIFETKESLQEFIDKLVKEYSK